MTIQRTDDFPGSSLAAQWTRNTQWNAEVITASQYRGGTNGDYSFAVHTGDTWANDQSCEITIGVTPTTWHFACVRWTGTGGASQTGYLMRLTPNGGNFDALLYRMVNSDPTAFLLQTVSTISGGASVGDRFKLEVIGTTLKMFKNDSQIGTNTTNSSLASGSPAIGILGTTNGIGFWTGQEEPYSAGGPTDRSSPRGVSRGIARGLARGMTKLNGLWQPKDTRLVIPVGIALVPEGALT